MIDTTKVGQLAAGMMERIADEYGEDARIGVVAVVVEVDSPPREGEPGWTNVTYRCTDSRRWVQAGLFEAAKRAVYPD